MQQKEKKLKALTSWRILKGLLLAIVLIGLVTVAVAYWYFAPHGRSVAAYCSQRQHIESSFDHGKYGAAGLYSDDAQRLADGFASLELHAPKDIRSDLKILVAIFEAVAAEPSRYSVVGIDGSETQKAGEHVREWTLLECK